jgi:hypothetical protein
VLTLHHRSPESGLPEKGREHDSQRPVVVLGDKDGIKIIDEPLSVRIL